MKRTILFAVLLSLLTVSVSAQKAKAPARQCWDNESDGPLYGDVESVTIAEYKFNNFRGIVVKYMNRKDVSKFNRQGDVIEKVDYNSDGSLDGKCLYKYDSQGNFTEQTRYEGEIMKPTRMEVREIVYRK